MKYGFDKSQRSTFSYWFAHWCAFQMVALNLHIWKPKYLLHDIEKPWLMLLWKDYKRVQGWHRMHNNHHIEYLWNHDGPIDIDAMIIDNECSRFTKSEAPLTAVEYLRDQCDKIKYRYTWLHGDKELRDGSAFYRNFAAALDRAKKLGLKK